jgi:ribokinase
VTRDGPATEIAAPRVQAVDATGAGDALNGALAAGLAGGLDLEVAARRAVVAASISVTKAGAREGYPSRAELRAAD